MGFLDTVLGIVGGIGRSLLGIPSPAASAVGGAMVAPTTLPAALPAIIPRVAGQIARAIPGQVGQIALSAAGPVVGAVVGALGGAGGGGVVMDGAIGRGNGQFARQTIVQTIRLIDGVVVRQEIFSGAPFLMQKAVRELRATTKKLTRANAKIPRRTREQSRISKLQDAVLDQALASARICPPKPTC